ncbi:tRNA synthetases class I-domain-containing protein [Thamnidium elegans]|nr:tRNA synthetases class I-domain-containing protein [Thamnidium elegans]
MLSLRSWRVASRLNTRTFVNSSVCSAKAPNPYTNTILLPKTNFPLRADAAKREHLFRDRCTKDLYPWQLKNNPNDLFILHDGPPYANGNVHCGHALNKILKDIVNRYKVLQGHKVFYRPGWDCHGLPIELKALEQIRRKGDDLSPVDIRKIAKAKALSEVEKQMAAFKSWSVMGDWDNPYLTLNSGYEIRQLRVLIDMIKNGYIYRQLKPVYWSPSSKSALAESELEYNEAHISQSIHVRFALTNLSTQLKQKWSQHKDINALIWTTTPWTIPSNKAISVHPELNYSLVKIENDIFVVASDRVDALQAELTKEIVVLDQVVGQELLGCEYKHPLFDEKMPIIGAQHVTAESGTGLVHTAPGHGMEDYEACLAHGIIPFSPVDDEGKFTKEAGEGLEGKEAFTEGTEAVIQMLGSSIILQQAYSHKYPYDWRTKKPVMLRATDQWFANVENLQKEAISVEYIIKILQERGTDAWWEETDDSVFVAPEYRNQGKIYTRGYDTMDVWFDSGTSWTMLNNIPDRDPTKPVADVYLEGSDQHRGWFQSSLLTSIAKGQKMSKSIGNTLEPALFVEGGKDKKKNPAYGTDVLRYWVANCEYTRDVTIGPSIMGIMSDSLRKIRTTARFLLGNLHDFKEENYIEYDKLQEVDKYMLHELYKYNDRVTSAYNDFAFNKVAQNIQNFTNSTLSSFYFDTIKDRLYNEPASSESRRMTQTVLYEILKSYTTSIAPFVCHTAEEIYENYKAITPNPESSIFKTGWVIPHDKWNNEPLNQKWSLLLELKGEINQALESARQEKYIRSSQEAEVSLYLNKESNMNKLVESMPDTELASLFMTSQVNIVHDNNYIQGDSEKDSEIQAPVISLDTVRQSQEGTWNHFIQSYRTEAKALDQVEEYFDQSHTDIHQKIETSFQQLQTDLNQHQSHIQTERLKHEREKELIAEVCKFQNEKVIYIYIYIYDI